MKLHYPLKAEDLIKLLDRGFDRAVELTKPVQDLADGLHALADGLAKLTVHVGIIAHNQMVHHSMIQQMWGVQQAIFRKLNANALDTSMPEIDKPEKIDPKDEAAVARKKAADKPN